MRSREVPRVDGRVKGLSTFARIVGYPRRRASSDVRDVPFDEKHRVAVVLGSGGVASAIAHRLDGEGLRVIMIDAIDPASIHRGMSFADAWYGGIAELDGRRAVFCASVRSIPSVLYGSGAIAATAWSWGGVVAALAPIVTIDTRAPSRRTRLDSVSAGSMPTLEVVPGAVVGPEYQRTIAPPALRPRATRLVYARQAGRFATSREIGERVREGDIVGAVGTAPVVAPVDGVLRGLCARGARVDARAIVADVDETGRRECCFGIDPRADAAAAAVSRYLQDERLVPASGAASSLAR
jgi:hypothetical protein